MSAWGDHIGRDCVHALGISGFTIVSGCYGFGHGLRQEVPRLGTRSAGARGAAMAEWENSWPEAEAALREAARVHAAALSREKDVMRQATRRAHASEKALRALPAALDRALAAETAYKLLQEQKGSPARPAPGPRDDGLVSEQAAAAAAAEAAEAAAAGAEIESEALCTLLCGELEHLEAQCAERETEHARENGALQQRWRDSDEAHKARQA